MGRRTEETRDTWRVVVWKRRRRKSNVVVNFCKNGEGRLKKREKKKPERLQVQGKQRRGSVAK